MKQMFVFVETPIISMVYLANFKFPKRDPRLEHLPLYPAKVLKS